MQKLYELKVGQKKRDLGASWVAFQPICSQRRLGGRVSRMERSDVVTADEVAAWKEKIVEGS